MFEPHEEIPKSDRIGNDRCLQRIFDDETAPTEAVALLLYFYTYELKTGRHCLQHDAELNLHLSPARLQNHLRWLIENAYVRRFRVYNICEFHYMYYVKLI